MEETYPPSAGIEGSPVKAGASTDGSTAGLACGWIGLHVLASPVSARCDRARSEQLQQAARTANTRHCCHSPVSAPVVGSVWLDTPWTAE